MLLFSRTKASGQFLAMWRGSLGPHNRTHMFWSTYSSRTGAWSSPQGPLNDRRLGAQELVADPTTGDFHAFWMDWDHEPKTTRYPNLLTRT